MWHTVLKPVPLPPLLSQFGGSPNELLDLLRQRVDDEMLMVIAGADVPFMTDLNFQVLRQIRDTGAVPVPLESNVLEVCNLVRWAEMDEPGCWSVDAGERGHLERAFACAVTLRSGGDKEMKGRFDGENSTVAPLVDSVLVLDGPHLQAALALLVWRLGRSYPLQEERPFFAFGVLLLFVVLRGSAEDSQPLAEALDWLEEEVSVQAAYQEALAEECRQRGLPFPLDVSAHYFGRWLLSLTNFDLRHHVWERLARQLLLERELPYSPAVNERLRHIGRLVTGKE